MNVRGSATPNSRATDLSTGAPFLEASGAEGRVPAFDLVIVTHNSAAVLPECLRQLGHSVDMRVSIVDSGSDDASYVLGLHSEGIRTLVEPNVGYGTAANAGFAGSRADWLVLMNPDVRIGIEALRRLVRRAADWGVDAVGPLIRDATGRVQDYPVRAMTPHWRRPRRWMPLGQFGECFETEVLSGELLVIRRAAFQRVGGFDTAFFLYAEEDDLVTRLRATGHVVARDPYVEAMHLGEASSGDVPRHWRVAQRLRGRFQYLRKHFTLVEACLALFLDVPRLWRRHGVRQTIHVLRLARQDPRTGTSAEERRHKLAFPALDVRH
jgi:GT2 family glycosyltransferase